MLSNSSTYKRILVYQLGSIGDTILSIPALNAIRRNNGPLAKISILHENRPENRIAPSNVLAGLGLVDEYISYPYKNHRVGQALAAITLWHKLKHLRYDAVIYLAPSERTTAQVMRDKWFFKLCGITTHIGFLAFSKESLCPVDEHGELLPVRNEALWRLDRLRISGLDVEAEYDFSKPFLKLPISAIEESRNWMALNRLVPSLPLVAICPGGKKQSTHWPIDRFIEIGHRLHALQTFELVVVGGINEKRVGDDMIKAWGKGLNAAGSLSVLGSAALLGQNAFIVGLDTGTTHLAAALGIRCVVLFGGQGYPGRWEPLGIGHYIKRNDVSCSGCGLEKCPKEDHPCMNGIIVEDVWESIIKLIDSINFIERRKK